MVPLSKSASVNPRLEDRLSLLRLHFQSLEDSLWFQVKEDLEFVEPTNVVQGMPVHDIGSGPLVAGLDVKEGEDKAGEGEKEEQLD